MIQATQKRLIKEYKSIFSILCELFILAVLLLNTDLSEKNRIDGLLLLSIIQAAIALTSFRIIRNKFVSFISIFFLLMFLFHLGEFILYYYTPTSPLGLIFDIRDADEYTLQRSIVYINKCFSLFVLGCWINYYSSRGFRLNRIDQNKCRMDMNNKTAASVLGVFLTLFGVVLKLYIDINKVQIMYKYGYAATYKFHTFGFVSLFSTFFEYGSAILLFVHFDDKRKRNAVLLLFVLIELFSLLSGSRGKVFVWIIILILIYIEMAPKSSFITYLKYFSICFVCFFLVAIIGKLRLYNERSNINYCEIISTSYIDPFFMVITEMGSTINSVYNSLITFPDNYTFSMGRNYVIGLLSVFPNIGDTVSHINEIIFFPRYFPNDYGRFAGGSNIGESYYAFGEYGFILFIAVGFFISKISYKFSKSIKTNDYIKFILLLPFLGTLLWWNRDYFSSMIREWIWMSIALYILYEFFSRIRKN